eukprot:1635310-Prymnesium_polylepis.1
MENIHRRVEKKIPSPTPDSRLPSRLASASQHRVSLSLSNYVVRMRGTTKLKDKHQVARFCAPAP